MAIKKKGNSYCCFADLLGSGEIKGNVTSNGVRYYDTEKKRIPKMGESYSTDACFDGSQKEAPPFPPRSPLARKY